MLCCAAQCAALVPVCCFAVQESRVQKNTSLSHSFSKFPHQIIMLAGGKAGSCFLKCQWYISFEILIK